MLKDTARECVPETILASITTATAQFSEDLNFGFERLLQGQTMVLIAGQKRYIIAASQGSVHRQVEKPITKRVLKGVQEGFVEDIHTNLALIQNGYGLTV
jgi:hypothetical protein